MDRHLTNKIARHLQYTVCPGVSEDRHNPAILSCPEMPNVAELTRYHGCQETSLLSPATTLSKQACCYYSFLAFDFNREI